MTFLLQNLKTGLNLIHSCLSNDKQPTKIKSPYSDWYDIVRLVPQGSFLGLLLFNSFINDLFLFIERTSICNFADDNTIHSCQNNLKTRYLLLGVPKVLGVRKV